jgi:hypothetical protein
MYTVKNYNTPGNRTPAVGCIIPRFQLWNAMVNRTPTFIGGVLGLINGVEMEDGSGHNFIVHLCAHGATHKVYVKDKV